MQGYIKNVCLDEWPHLLSQKKQIWWPKRNKQKWVCNFDHWSLINSRSVPIMRGIETWEVAVTRAAAVASLSKNISTYPFHGMANTIIQNCRMCMLSDCSYPNDDAQIQSQSTISDLDSDLSHDLGHNH